MNPPVTLSLSKGAPRSYIAAFTALAALVAAPSLATAEGPATIRGLAYVCSNHAPWPDALVTLHRLDDDTYVYLAADRRGRFARVGLTPGRYVISVQGAGDRRTRVASRLARLDTDDVLDMSIGGDPGELISSYRPPDSYHPHPLCDDPLVPPAPPTSDRYVIR